MIRKWFKFHTSFIDLLKNSTAAKNFDQKWFLDSPYRHHASCNNLHVGSVSQSFTSLSTGTIKFVKPLSDPKERGDGENLVDIQENERHVEETPAKTELLEIKGPNGSAFLVEVKASDLEEIEAELTRLKGDFFQFDKTIVDWFTVKCMLAAEPLTRAKDQMRLAKIHAISSGSEDVYELVGTGQFLFVNVVDRMMRTKRILEKLGYKVSGILYQFQPKQRVKLQDDMSQMCNNFVRAVERIPQVISVTHNL